jgi:hypothetical protein
MTKLGSLANVLLNVFNLLRGALRFIGTGMPPSALRPSLLG